MRVLVVAVLAAACGGKDSGSGAGSVVAGSAKPPRPKLALARCADAPPRPTGGGGGTGWGMIGTGRYGTIGHGGGYGPGRSRPSISQTSIGQPNAQGDLDKAIIRRYIKRRIQQITYCYEKELLANPQILGTIQTQFFITPEGRVSTVSASGFDQKVADCVGQVIKNIEFPKPKGGGGVQVNYPFTFRPADSTAPLPPSPAPPPPDPVQGGAFASLTGTGDVSKPLDQWTPFARDSFSASDDTTSTATATTDAVTGRLPELDHCFDSTDATGTLRAMIDFDADGKATVRAGGFGDPSVEACVARALGAVHVKPTQPREVACDLVRGGDDAPLRATVSSQYTVIGATRAGVVIDGRPVEGTPAIVHDKVALVIAEVDAPGATVGRAVAIASAAPSQLVSVHDASGATAPLLVGSGPTSVPGRYALELTGVGGLVHGCIHDHDLGGETAITDARALTAAIQTWQKSCGEPCEVHVAASTLFANELARVSAAARAAGVPLLRVEPDPSCTR